MNVILEILLPLSICYNFGKNFYTGKWLGFLSISLVFLWHKTTQKYGWLLATTLTYFLAHSFYLLLIPPPSYVALSNENLAIIKYLTADSSLRLLVIFLPFLLYDIRRWYQAESLACFFVLVSFLQIFREAYFHGCAGENACGGPLDNPSLNAGLLVCCLPFIFEGFKSPQKWLIAALAGLAVVLGKSNVGLGMLGIFLLIQLPKKYWLALPPLFLLAGHFIGPKFLSSGDRFLYWRFFIERWYWGRHNLMFGTGYGTFGAVSGAIQEAFNMNPGRPWRWLHNDWLQSIFETGFTGGALMLSTYCQALRGLWKKKLFPHLQALSLFGVYMGCNFPLHLGMPSMFGAWLLCRGLVK